jgi:hypothetical protein
LGGKIEWVLFAKIEMWIAILSTIVALLLFGAWGYAVLRWHIFPYRTIAEVQDFLRGAPSDHRSLGTRLKSELGYNPAALEAPSSLELLPRDKLSPVRAVSDSDYVPEIDGMSFYSVGGPRRYFLVFGSFVFPEQKTHWGAIVIDSEGVVHRGWAIRPDRYEYPGAHIGLAVTGDGRITTSAHGVLTAYGWCGEKLWEAPWEPLPDGQRRHHDSVDGYDWHHDIVAQNGRLYTFRGPAVMTVDAASGKILSEMHVVDLIRWGRRENLDLFGARSRTRGDERDLSRKSLSKLYLDDPFHFNKVDVLTAELAHLYPEFEAGDMLISLRRLNLVIVVRPSEERIVWWRYGLTSAQHDASFVEGHVEVFDNNPASEPARPRIARLDLDSQEAETVFDLSRWKMIMRSKGNFERRGQHLLTVDDDAGRVIAGRLDGTIDFLFENGWRAPDDEVVRLQLRNATEIEPETFARLEDSCAR